MVQLYILSKLIKLYLIMNMKLIKAIKGNSSIEFIVENNGSRFLGVLSVGNSFNWIAFPELNVCCQLAHFDDEFWNLESLCSIIPSKEDVKTIMSTIRELKSMFDDDSQYFDGKRFLSQHEYIFWLEYECESLSRQIIKFETAIENSEVDKWLERERVEYYKYMRIQYDDI